MSLAEFSDEPTRVLRVGEEYLTPLVPEDRTDDAQGWRWWLEGAPGLD